MLQRSLATLALLGLALLLGATVYESVVMAPNYEREIPRSIELAREFLQRTTPAHYFRVVAPVTLALLLAGVVACWRVPAARWWMAGGLGALAVGDLITFTFHYPRLAVMFKSSPRPDAVRLGRAAREWGRGNLVRAALLLVALLSVLQAFGALAAGSAG